MEFQRSKHHSFSESILRHITIHILLALRGCRCCQGRLRSPTLALGGWMMSEIEAGELRNLTRAEMIFHTHAATACKGVRPTMRNPNSGEVRPNQKCIGCASDTNEKRRRCRIREEERRCCRSEKGHFAVRPPHVSRGRSIRGRVLQLKGRNIITYIP